MITPGEARRDPERPEETRRNPKIGVIRGVIPRSSEKEMVLGKRNGISFDGIAIIILLTFLPHTLKFQNPKFCGVSLCDEIAIADFLGKRNLRRQLYLAHYIQI
jgi:hypothetical protein